MRIKLQYISQVCLVLIMSACQLSPTSQGAASLLETQAMALPGERPETRAVSDPATPRSAPGTAVTATALVLPAPGGTASTPLPTGTATLLPTPQPPVTTTLLFVGVIVPARCVQASLDQLGDPDHPYKEVKPVISAADLAVGVFNATMSDRVTHTGCQKTYQLVGSPDNADAMARAGFDLMSVATNHIKDCGLMKGWCDYTFFDTLDNLQRVNIQTVGAGRDLQQALQPVVVALNGVRFAFVSLGDSKMNEIVFASETNPGIAYLNEENARQAITAARQEADVVIALPHWGSEDNYIPNWIQRQQARYLVDAGADVVVGNHTHVVQAIQEIEGKPVFYGLGNFVFDQDLRDHRQAIMLLVHFVGTRYVGYELIPTVGDRDGRAHIAEPDEAASILEKIEAASQAIK